MITIKEKDFLSWVEAQIGKEFKAQARGPNAYDCVGLVVGCANEFNIPVQDLKGYANIPSDGLFLKAIDNNLKRITIEEATVGDLIIFAWDGEYHHIALIIANKPNIEIAHALNKTGFVTKHDFTNTSWEKLRHKFYRFKDVVIEKE